MITLNLLALAIGVGLLLTLLVTEAFGIAAGGLHQGAVQQQIAGLEVLPGHLRLNRDLFFQCLAGFKLGLRGVPDEAAVKAYSIHYIVAGVDALGAGKLSVGPPYFNSVFIPLMLPVALITVVAAYLRRRRLMGSAEAVARRARASGRVAAQVLFR